MPTKVLKFGGTSLASAEAIRKCIDIITKNTDTVYVVVSAPGKRFPEDRKVTDLLEEFFAHPDEALSREALRHAHARFCEIINDLGFKMWGDPLGTAMYAFETLDRTQMTRDYIVTRGEYVMAFLLARALDTFPVTAPVLAGVIKCDTAGTCDETATRAALNAHANRSTVYIVPGFYGHLPNGAPKAFKRGGSDISGAIIAALVDASVYENWTDTNGVQTASPQFVPTARTLTSIRYPDLRNLAYRGAEILHPDALLPVSRAGIVTEVRNTFNPDGPFTRVVVDTERSLETEPLILGVTCREGFTTLTLEREDMDAAVGYVDDVLAVIRRYGIAFAHIASGVDSVSIVIPVKKKEDEAKLEKLLATIKEECRPDKLYRDKDLAVICVVPSRALSVTEVAGRAFSALAAARIEVHFIDQGGRNQGLVFGVKRSDYVKALEDVHDIFFLN